MKILWLVYSIDGDWERGYTSSYASVRYRAIVPATQLRSMGHAVSFATMHTWQCPATDLPDVIVVSKQFGFNDPWRYGKLAERLRRQLEQAVMRGVRIVSDYCDDYFSRAGVQDHWRALAALSHLCTAGSQEMATTVALHTSAPVRVVGDPIGSPHAEPRVYRADSMLRRTVQSWLSGGRAKKRLRMIWYGSNSTSFAPVLDWATTLTKVAERTPWLLTLVTAPNSQLDETVAAFNAKHAPKSAIEFLEWTEQDQWEAVRHADVVLIPTDTSDLRTLVKSSNRLVDGLNMGCYVIASPLPAYQAYAAHSSLTDRPVEALTAYLDDPDLHLERIRSGQKAVMDNASAALVTEQWLSALAVSVSDAMRRDVTSTHTIAMPTSVVPTTPIRLNLGCGDQILAGYVNVDIAEACAGRSPDVICDLCDLRMFPNNHADEVLAVHVIDRFWRWEAEAMLHEWARVLKPGGHMVLECMNLKSACEAFLAGPDNASQPSKDRKPLLWAFYGSTRLVRKSHAPLWGYTPHTLSKLLHAAGMRKILLSTPICALSKSHDIRVVATKS